MAISVLDKAIIDDWMAEPGQSLVKLITKHIKKAKPYPPACVRRFNAIMRKPEVELYVARQIAMLQDVVDIKAVDATRFLEGTLNSNIIDFIKMQDDEHLAVKDLTQLDRSLTAQVKKIKIRTTTNTYDNGSEVKNTTVELELYDKMKAIELLAKLLKWWETNNNGTTLLGVIVVPEGSTKEEQWANYVQLPDGNQLIPGDK